MVIRFTENKATIIEALKSGKAMTINGLFKVTGIVKADVRWAISDLVKANVVGTSKLVLTNSNAYYLASILKPLFPTNDELRLEIGARPSQKYQPKHTLGAIADYDASNVPMTVKQLNDQFLRPFTVVIARKLQEAVA